MGTTLRRRLLDAMDQRVDPRVVARLGSLYLSARARSRCTVRYDGGQWIHQYQDGVVVDTALGGLPPRGQDRNAEDVFLFGYRPRPGDVVFDVGAGVGSEVRLFSRLVGPAGRVVSVEAHPITFGCLCRTVALNQLTNVTLVECALVGEPGPVLISDDPLAHIRNGLTEDVGGAIAVPGRTLGELMESVGVDRVDLLKMNIEGAELQVLEGARDVLKVVDHLAVSCHDFLADAPERAWQRTFGPVSALLREAGYVLRTRPDDPRPWVRHYLYASRPPR